MSGEKKDILEKLIPELRDRRTGIGYLWSLKDNPVAFEMLVCPFCDNRESCHDIRASVRDAPLVMDNPKFCYRHVGSWILKNGRMLVMQKERANDVLDSLSSMDEDERYEFLCSRCPYSEKCHDCCGESRMLQVTVNDQDLRRKRDMKCLKKLWDFFMKNLVMEEE